MAFYSTNRARVLRRCCAALIGLGLALALIGCGGNAAPPEPTVASPTPTARPTEAAPSTPLPLPSPTAAPIPDGLGETVRIEEGGYLFRPPLDYVGQQNAGLIVMAPRGAHPDLGPRFILAGGPLQVGETLQDRFVAFLAVLAADSIAIGPASPVVVNQLPALAVDLTGEPGGVPLIGRAVLIDGGDRAVLVFAGAEGERWEQEIAALYDAVLQSVLLLDDADRPIAGVQSTVGRGLR